MEQLSEFVTSNWELFLALVVILALLVRSFITEKISGCKAIDPYEAVALMNHDEALFLDVRTDGEIAEGRVLNSVHIPLGALKQRLTELNRHRTRPIVVGCRSGHRSGQACGILRKHGFDQVYNLRGGLIAWQNASLPMIRKAKK